MSMMPGVTNFPLPSTITAPEGAERFLPTATIFPSCRAVVHHGGAGTTAAGLRAGVPTLVLWMADVQVIWGAAVKGLKVGTSRRFSAATEKTLVADLRTILAPQYRDRARQIATRMTRPAEMWDKKSRIARGSLGQIVAEGTQRPRQHYQDDR